MLKSYPLTTRFLTIVFLPLLAIAIAGLLYLRRSLPREDKLTGAGLLQPVEITRDGNGVVMINARRDHDAFFAMGFAHAQDRMWQLELERRIARGRLSEVFGRTTISQDAWMRTLGLYDSARLSWPKLSAEAQASLTAYADGINSWLKQNPVLPPEFLVLDVKPEPWSELDSLAWSQVFELNLAGNMWNEISNLAASRYLNKEQMSDLLGSDLLNDDLLSNNLPGSNKVAGKLADLLTLRQGLESELKIGGQYVGSNAWVVSGKFMQSGQATLANDPHLGLQIPSLWYVAHLKGDKLDVSGMTLVGLPVVIFGENRQIAWGGTSMMADVQDLYIEETNPRDPAQYKHNGVWMNFDTHWETIRVKAEFPAFLRSPVEPVTIRIRETLNGPIVSDVIAGFEQPVALQWTALRADDTSYESFLRVDYAHDWATFKDAFHTHVAPALNMLYADKSNNIGSFGIGRIPIRAKGKARLPVPGWTNEYAWTGYIPFKDWPQCFNPEKGFIVSANNKPVDASYPYFISEDWAPPYRAQRIEQLLQDKISRSQLISLGDIAQMQGDTMDLSVRGLLEYLKKIQPSGPEQQRVLHYLSEWQGNMARDSQGAAIFFVWTRILREELFSARLKEHWSGPNQDVQLSVIVSATSYDRVLHALTERPSHWCSQEEDSSGRSCTRLVTESLNQAIDELKKLRGPNPKFWRWGDIHRTLYAHMPFSRSNLLSPIFNREVPSGGSTNTINVGNAVYKESAGYEETFSAGFRQVIQIGEGSMHHAFMNSTGQSGNVLSPHYGDMVQPFTDLQYYELNTNTSAGKMLHITIVPE
jgi:penicillin amidase